MTDDAPFKGKPRRATAPPQLAKAVWALRSDAGKVIRALLVKKGWSDLDSEAAPRPAEGQSD